MLLLLFVETTNNIPTNAIIAIVMLIKNLHFIIVNEATKFYIIIVDNYIDIILEIN
jgi:hypothetical protein